MSDKKPLRVLFCIGVNQNFMDATAQEMKDVWVWDIYRTDRFVNKVRVLTFKDVNIEELSGKAFKLPKELQVGE